MTMHKRGIIRLGLPKGHMEQGVLTLLADAGVQVESTSRRYRPRLSIPMFEAKLLKPQNIIEMLHLGSRDIGFAGSDWARELKVELIELIDTELDPVRLVAACPADLLEDGKLPDRPLVIATEYMSIAGDWVSSRAMNATLVRSYGATEVFPPEDADAIIDNTATGATLSANGLVIIEEIMRSTTHLFANPAVLDNPVKREEIENFVVLVQSVLEARKRVMLEINVPRDRLDALIATLPFLRSPTVSPLKDAAWFAIKIAAPYADLPSLIPRIKALGGTDIVVTKVAQLIP